jgi:hypothetical protein
MPILFSRLSQCLSMRSDQLWQAVGTFPLFSHVRIIERRDRANLFETFLPALHPRMRRRSARAGSEEKERLHQSQPLQFKTFQLASVRPTFHRSHQAGRHRIVPHIIPLLAVALARTQ